jgi:hypothetical protein
MMILHAYASYCVLIANQKTFYVTIIGLFSQLAAGR